MENQRSTFRVQLPMEAELFHEGHVVACRIENLSAGGAALVTALEMQVGSQCTLGLRLDPSFAERAGVDYLSFHLQVLERVPVSGGDLRYRTRNLTSEGSEGYEQAQKVVFEAQRRLLAEEHDASGSPMDEDTTKRRRRRLSEQVRRFSRGAMRPGAD